MFSYNVSSDLYCLQTLLLLPNMFRFPLMVLQELSPGLIPCMHDPYNYFGRILVSSECWFLGVHRIIDRRAQLESSLNAFLKQINACSLHSLAESQPNTEIKTEYFIHPKSLDTCYAYDYYEWLQSKLYYHKHGFFIIWITI